MEDKPSIFFKKWRKWFYWVLLESVGEPYKVRLIPGPRISEDRILKLEEQRVDPYLKMTRQIKFVQQFLKLCERYGFTPEDLPLDSELELRTGLYIEFVEACSDFYYAHSGKATGPLIKEMLLRPKLDPQAPYRTRFPTKVAQAILYYLEKFKSDPERISLLKDYFENDFRNVLEELDRRTRNAMAKKGETLRFTDVSISTPSSTVRSLETLFTPRGDDGLRLWTSHRYLDLLRVVLSKDEPKIIKNFKGRKRQRLQAIEEIIALGDLNIR